MELIKTKDLSFAFKDDELFRDINLEVLEKDYVILIGPNGTGKSTLFKCLLKQVSFNSGTISLFNTPIKDFYNYRLIGYLQQNSFESIEGFPATCLELVNLNNPYKNGWRKDNKYALLALKKVGMEQYAKKIVADLSGGQKQRIMIATILVANPRVLLLDEPTTGLDVKSIEQLLTLLKQLNREGISILMITHDVSRVVNDANKFYCLEHGNLLEINHDQILKEVTNKHQHPNCKGDC